MVKTGLDCPIKFFTIPFTDELNVKSEEDVFKAAMDWIEYDLPARRTYLEKVFKHVRFPLMSGIVNFSLIYNIKLSEI